MPAQLIVKCPEYLQVVREFADETHQRDDFEKQLAYLTTFKDDTWKVELSQDFAPFSFLWTEIRPNGKRGLAGGLIYHSSHDSFGNGSTPTFSVNIIPCQGWQIHT
jgi:hypothetical protein